MKTQNKIHWQKSLFTTLGLILLIVGASFLVTQHISQMEEQAAFKRLSEETDGLRRDVETHMESDQELLRVLSVIIASYDNPADPELWALLDSYPSVGLFSSLALLLPDNTIVSSGGQIIPSNGQLSFEEEAARGAHVTDRVSNITSSSSYILRHFVPVIRDGETIAMLYGVIELNSLLNKLLVSPYGDRAAIYIIDGNTGDFLMDTWHTELGNFWALGERPMAPGYDNKDLQQGLMEGKYDYVVFVSNTTGEYLYFYYEPMSINNWRIALSVPESEVFADARAIQKHMNVFLFFESVCFILYFLYMIHYVRQETSTKQRQLETVRHIYDVEKLLFNAHEKRENIWRALEMISHATSAERAAFWMLTTLGNDGIFYVWDEAGGNAIDTKTDAQKESCRFLLNYFKEGNTVFEAERSEMLKSVVPTDFPHPIKNMMAVPVMDLENQICGILAICNTPAGHQTDSALLKSISFSFGMFFHNSQLYNTVKEQGERDILSGLYNRNRYEQDLSGYLSSYHASLACIYVDANGLHELNNSQGHAAGDQMIQSIARRLQKEFGAQHSYRIGGDEFLAFAIDMDEDTVTRLGQQLEDDLAKEQIHVSVGIQWETEVHSMDQLVKSAEKKMYAAKRTYYGNMPVTRRQGI